MRIQPYIPYSISIETEALNPLSQRVAATRDPLRRESTHAHFNYPTYAPLVEDRSVVEGPLDERPELWNLIMRLH